MFQLQEQSVALLNKQQQQQLKPVNGTQPAYPSENIEGEGYINYKSAKQRKRGSISSSDYVDSDFSIDSSLHPTRQRKRKKRKLASNNKDLLGTTTKQPVTASSSAKQASTFIPSSRSSSVASNSGTKFGRNVPNTQSTKIPLFKSKLNNTKDIKKGNLEISKLEENNGGLKKKQVNQKKQQPIEKIGETQQLKQERAEKDVALKIHKNLHRVDNKLSTGELSNGNKNRFKKLEQQSNSKAGTQAGVSAAIKPTRILKYTCKNVNVSLPSSNNSKVSVAYKPPSKSGNLDEPNVDSPSNFIIYPDTESSDSEGPICQTESSINKVEILDDDGCDFVMKNKEIKRRSTSADIGERSFTNDLEKFEEGQEIDNKQIDCSPDEEQSQNKGLQNGRSTSPFLLRGNSRKTYSLVSSTNHRQKAPFLKCLPPSASLSQVAVASSLRSASSSRSRVNSSVDFYSPHAFGRYRLNYGSPENERSPTRPTSPIKPLISSSSVADTEKQLGDTVDTEGEIRRNEEESKSRGEYSVSIYIYYFLQYIHLHADYDFRYTLIVFCFLFLLFYCFRLCY